MPSGSQISAFVSDSTREQLERYAEAHGLKKGHLVEQALLHHLQALRELPSDIIIPARVVLSRKGAEALAARLARPARPTKALRDLMKRDGD